MRKNFIALILTLATLTGYAQNRDIISSFPKATDGKVRYVIQLPPQKEESNYKIEIQVGKIMKVDCNRHGLTGSFEEKNLEGWGYSYFEYNSEGKVFSTQMGCPDKTRHAEFVFDTRLAAYNSRMPLIVYVPKDMEVRYKIWQRQARQYKGQAK